MSAAKTGHLEMAKCNTLPNNLSVQDACLGKLTVNTEPTDGLDSTINVPPCDSVISREINRAKPELGDC